MDALIAAYYLLLAGLVGASIYLLRHLPMDRFKRELDEAIKRGVHVDAFVIDEQLKLEKFRCKHLECAAPSASRLLHLPLLSMPCFALLQLLQARYQLHEEYALYVCFGNLVSIIAFGFNGPPVIRLPKKKD